MLDSAIHWINLYPLDSAIGFPNTYPPDSTIQRLNNRGQVAFVGIPVHHSHKNFYILRQYRLEPFITATLVICSLVITATFSGLAKLMAIH